MSSGARYLGEGRQGGAAECRGENMFPYNGKLFSGRAKHVSIVWKTVLEGAEEDFRLQSNTVDSSRKESISKSVNKKTPGDFFMVKQGVSKERGPVRSL